jgi:hypothetical protein
LLPESQEDFAVTRVFLSHSEEDAAFAQRLRGDLARSGFNVWFDEDAIGGGESIIDSIASGLDACDSLCLLNSRHSRLSRWVKHEVEQFYSRTLSSHDQRTIVVLRLDDSEIPHYLRHLKHISFVDYTIGLRELVECLRSCPSGGPCGRDGGTTDNHLLIRAFFDSAIVASDLYSELRRNVFHDRSVDQKFLYWNVDSAKLWVDICEHSSYPLYHRSIDLLLEKCDPEMLASLENATGYVSSFVNVGVGSGRKDYLIVKSLLKKWGHLHYVAVDTSFPMLQETVRHVEPLLDEYRGALDVTAVIGDVECLSRYAALFQTDGPILFGFLGSNISNFRENRVLEAFHGTMGPRDALLLEVDWIGSRTYEEIIEGYSDLENMKFLWQPLSFLGMQKPGDWQDRFSFRCETHYTDVPGAVTVVSRYHLDTGAVVLATSTKYDPAPFLKHLDEHLAFNVAAQFSVRDDFGLLLLTKRR